MDNTQPPTCFHVCTARVLSGWGTLCPGCKNYARGEARDYRQAGMLAAAEAMMELVDARPDERSHDAERAMREARRQNEMEDSKKMAEAKQVNIAEAVRIDQQRYAKLKIIMCPMYKCDIVTLLKMCLFPENR